MRVWHSKHVMIGTMYKFFISIPLSSICAIASIWHRSGSLWCETRLWSTAKETCGLCTVFPEQVLGYWVSHLDIMLCCWPRSSLLSSVKSVHSLNLFLLFRIDYVRDLSKTEATIYLTLESHMCRKPDSLVYFYLIYFYIYWVILILFWFVVLKDETTLKM